jgi:uncharacterized protein (DUF849 family)
VTVTDGRWIKACLNGSRRPGDHPALPLTPEQTAADAARVVAAGAAAVHVHTRDAEGRQSLAAADVDATVRAVRARVPGLAIGVTTGAWIERDPERRLALVRDWTDLPDFASVNFSEDGAAALARLLLERGVGVEAGLWSPDDARALVAAGLGGACVRLLIEPRDRDAAAALATARAIEAALDDAGVGTPRLLHGGGPAAWAVLRDALRRGLQTRIGLEDTLELPDGRRTAGNAELMAAAMGVALAG